MQFSIEGTTIELTMFEAQAAMDKLERSVALRGTMPTVSLLLAIVDWLKLRHGISTDLSSAWALWWSVCEIIDRVRKKHQVLADVGAWLHIDATALNDEQLFGLHANIVRAQAQHRYFNGQFDPKDYEGVYQLVLQATGDENAASAARLKALESLVDTLCGAKG